MKKERRFLKLLSAMMAVFMLGTLAACFSQPYQATEDEEAVSKSAVSSAANGPETATEDAAKRLSERDIAIDHTIENTEDGGHAISADGESLVFSNTLVTKTGDSTGDEADFYGEDAAIFAANGATLNLFEMVIKSDGTHANAVFSYGEGTTVNISDSYIETQGNCSGGLMTTGGGTMNAENLTVITSGNSSAAIRSDRGGGTVNVTGGYYAASGKGSPAIYSTADITVSDAELVSTSAQGVVVEGKNSVTLQNVTLNADNSTKNSDKSSTYQAVMIYQSMSGDASEGKSSFTMNGGTLMNENGDIFFVNNTATDISLNNAQIINNGGGVFLRAEAAGWGNDGSNGGKVNLYADNQTISGDMVVDDISTLNLYLKSGSSLSGAINTENSEGEIYVEIESGSKWTLTGNSYITSLTCDAGAIDLNGYTLYVNGTAYTEGSSSSGEAIEISVSSSSSGGHDSPPAKPGAGGSSDHDTPPSKP